MKIVKLTAENVKRLKAVEITPTGSVQVVAGANGAGKTSVIDSIMFALAGKGAQSGTPNVIREGEKSATVTVDLGELKVTRRWTPKTDTLTVETADGTEKASPQKILDGLMGKIAFDPLAFTRLNATAQRDLLLTLVDLPFSVAEHDAKRAEVYTHRASLAPRLRELGAERPVADGLPAEEIDIASALERVNSAQQMADAHTEVQRRIAILTETVHDLRGKLVEAEGALADATTRLDRLPPAPDMEKARAWLGSIEETNRAIRASREAIEHNASIASIKQERDRLTEQLANMDAGKAEALAAAKFPLEGISFDENGVSFRGQPLTQASAAEQILVSAAIGMELNPTVRVMRIMDGSLLDNASMAALERLAEANDFQIWVERVGDTGTAGAVIIENGEIRNG